MNCAAMVTFSAVSASALFATLNNRTVFVTRRTALESGYALRSRKLSGFRLSLENVGSDMALRERLAEFKPHECTCSVARCRTVIALLEIRDHGEIRVAHQWIEIKAVIARDQGDWFADFPAAPFDLASDPVNVFHRPDLKTLKVYEKDVAEV